MKIFATTDFLFSPAFPITSGNNSRKDFVYGAWVGGENFYRALLKYGTFDEYHFFVDSKLSANLLKKSMLYLDISLDRVRIIDISDLASCLEKIKYTVFFTIGIDLSRLSYLRSKYAKDNFPVCGIAFQTISYSHLLRNEFLNNMVSGLYPFDSIICTSSAVKRAIQNLNRLVGSSFQKKTGLALNYNGRLDHLHFGINVCDYGRISKLEARQKLGLAQDKIIILYFGRFSLYDKADLYPLLVAFKEILAKKSNVMFLLGGVNAQGNYGGKLKHIAKEMGLSSCIKFNLGYSSEKKKKALFSASDIFISPSDNIQESFGITILEAMASGLPIIVSDWNGYKDLIIHNETGFRIPTYWTDCKTENIHPSYSLFDFWQRDHLYLAQSVCVDVKKITEYLSILVKNKELRLSFGESARDEVLKKYDWKVIIPAYEKLWLKLSKLSKGYKTHKFEGDLFMPKYFYSFRHYPTRILDNKTRITISKSGLLFLKTRKLPFKIQEELQNIILITIILMILSFLFEKHNATIAEVETYTKRILKVKANIVRYNIMWLFKKDLLMFNSI